MTCIFLRPISLAPVKLQRMLLRLSKFDIQVKYVGSKSVLLVDTFSRPIQPDSTWEIPGLDINIAQALKVEPTCLESLQEETKAYSTLATLTDLIITGQPNGVQDLPEHLHPYWCFRDELTILDGIVMKGSRVSSLKARDWELSVSCMTHIKVSPQCSNMQDALCIGQRYKMTSVRWSKNAMSVKGMATRSPDLQNGRSQPIIEWKSLEWIWWISEASMP